MLPLEGTREREEGHRQWGPLVSKRRESELGFSTGEMEETEKREKRGAGVGLHEQRKKRETERDLINSYFKIRDNCI